MRSTCFITSWCSADDLNSAARLVPATASSVGIEEERGNKIHYDIIIEAQSATGIMYSTCEQDNGVFHA